MSEPTRKNLEAACWPRGIHAITLFVDDLVAGRHFYGKVFGLPMVFQDDDSTAFQFGGTIVNLLKSTAADELIAPVAVADPHFGSRVVFTIQVEDVDAMCRELTSRGVTLLNGPIDRRWGVRTASFSDPDGHIWEIAR